MMAVYTFLRRMLEITFGFGAGAITASGLFALITSIQLINRFAVVTKTERYLELYENMVVAGAIMGNVIFIFNISFRLGTVSQVVMSIVFGFISGIFIGTFLVCLAETIKTLPIFVRRVRIGAGLGWIILSIALGKCAGHLAYYLLLYKK